MDKCIAVFSYDFPHRKTTDFLQLIRAKGYHNVVVFAAPMKKLSHQDNRQYFSKFNAKFNVIDTKELCKNLGYKFIPCEHDDVSLIARHIDEFKVDTAIISGARIIKKKVIDLFSFGIVNIHPGILPETAGLDAFYYTLVKDVAPGVTVHTINHKVDEGNCIAFFEYEISGVESLAEIQEALYHCQLKALSNFLDSYAAGEIIQKPIYRPLKNEPMLPEQKLSALSYFGFWRSSQQHRQRIEKLISACEEGAISEFYRYDPHSNFVNTRLVNSWTALIIASFNQNFELVKYLVERGADVNYCTPKGTTVLMYAKSALVNAESPDCRIIDYLVKNGADVKAKDIFGKTVMDYVSELGDDYLKAIFAEYINNAVH
ncbi:MAG: ankyrin repeat domain-containing protein [Gammaproteobacteria bacterium]|nr:ankyrin repeat domain-containing protein [Gammaproteobacteria bacterium]MBU2058442.1 ankyrin repeat domain-containing protein [Gammaproteobacteria bacterium]MBU2176505.1 ankyrin repeat domain-containing protein [Gammaproteobacteria bacterium]MBU2248553.1 ankyrin repeat domain-containing protein [Gammaproteobacteria bacterium]MBU2345584.1 ankyrin repeat domain-containing protein [Gammaproteobacteria bacterium]